MTSTEDVNDEGRAVPITLDLTDDRAYTVLVHALADYASAARQRAAEYAGRDEPNTVGALESFDYADMADSLRIQIETQIDALSAPEEKTK